MAASLGLLWMVSGCDPDDGDNLQMSDVHTLVGAVKGTDIELGVLLDGDDIVVYQCGGTQTFQSHTVWFRGQLGADADTFRIVREGMTLEGARIDEGFEGELIDPDGRQHSFRVEAGPVDSPAGLYVSTEYDRVTGVIVREQEGQWVAQGASCTVAPRECAQVIILAPLALTGGLLAVQIDDGESMLDIDVARTVTAPAEVW